jgi:hypothetical protein
MKEPFILNNIDIDNSNIPKNKSTNTDSFKNSNFISKLFFCWACKLLRQAKKSSLKNDNLGKLEGRNKSENFMKDLFYFWDVRGYKKKNCCRLLSTTMRANLCNY